MAVRFGRMVKVTVGVAGDWLSKMPFSAMRVYRCIYQVCLKQKWFRLGRGMCTRWLKFVKCVQRGLNNIILVAAGCF